MNVDVSRSGRVGGCACAPLGGEPQNKDRGEAAPTSSTRDQGGRRALREPGQPCLLPPRAPADLSNWSTLKKGTTTTRPPQFHEGVARGTNRRRLPPIPAPRGAGSRRTEFRGMPCGAHPPEGRASST